MRYKKGCAYHHNTFLRSRCEFGGQTLAAKGQSSYSKNCRMLRRPDFFCSPKRNRGKKTAHRGGLFTKTPSPMYPSSYVRNKSDQERCQQCSTGTCVPINTTHFSAHGAGTETFCCTDKHARREGVHRGRVACLREQTHNALPLCGVSLLHFLWPNKESGPPEAKALFSGI